MKLMREVRCFPPLTPDADSHPAERGGAFWTVRTVVEGPVDPQTGYVFDIKAVDRFIVQRVVPYIAHPQGPDPGPLVPAALSGAFRVASAQVPPPAALDSIQLSVSPDLAFSVNRRNPDMVYVTRTFDFCAAHRLYCKDFSEDQNRRVFGPCSNPNWHGHNYRLEVTVAAVPDGPAGTVIDPPQLDRIVNERAVEPFDHKNLNLECDDFADLNPSVENIARVIWNRLHGAFGQAALTSVRVWETSKTYAEFNGE